MLGSIGVAVMRKEEEQMEVGMGIMYRWLVSVVSSRDGSWVIEGGLVGQRDIFGQWMKIEVIDDAVDGVGNELSRKLSLDS